jgi:membrane protease YdiL (CAAX protease family)
MDEMNQKPRSAALSEAENSDLAPRWHTVALISLILMVATLGMLLRGRGGDATPPTAPRSTAVYLPILLVQWGMTFYVTRVGRARNALPALIGTRWRTPARAAMDIGLAIGLAVLIVACEIAWSRWGGSRGTAALLPTSSAEKAWWVLVAASAGFCEEVVYRGYLRMQLSAFAHSETFGVVAQGLLFGIAHGEQGTPAMVRYAIYGIAFGVLARARSSLLPGIACHVGIDLAAGLLSG